MTTTIDLTNTKDKLRSLTVSEINQMTDAELASLIKATVQCHITNISDITDSVLSTFELKDSYVAIAIQQKENTPI